MVATLDNPGQALLAEAETYLRSILGSEGSEGQNLSMRGRPPKQDRLFMFSQHVKAPLHATTHVNVYKIALYAIGNMHMNAKHPCMQQHMQMNTKLPCMQLETCT